MRSICRCNLAKVNSSSNNSLFGSVGDRSFAASVTNIKKVNFSDVNIRLIVGSKILPAVDVSALCNDLTIDIFNFSKNLNKQVVSKIIDPISSPNKG